MDQEALSANPRSARLAIDRQSVKGNAAAEKDVLEANDAGVCLSGYRKPQASKALEMMRAYHLFLLGECLPVFCEHGPSSRDIENLLCTCAALVAWFGVKAINIKI
jgi:hypothetical protein